jgi:hypothetical protein
MVMDEMVAAGAQKIPHLQPAVMLAVMQESVVYEVAHKDRDHQAGFPFTQNRSKQKPECDGRHRWEEEGYGDWGLGILVMQQVACRCRGASAMIDPPMKNILQKPV